jgi:acyl-homoserine-lactone acylase
MATKEFTVYRTHHGPVVRKVDGKWVSVKLMEEPLKALMQSYTRTKAKNLREYLEVMKLHTNSSNNTLFADAEGNFGYFHSNFIPGATTGSTTPSRSTAAIRRPTGARRCRLKKAPMW